LSNDSDVGSSYIAINNNLVRDFDVVGFGSISTDQGNTSGNSEGNKSSSDEKVQSQSIGGTLVWVSRDIDQSFNRLGSKDRGSNDIEDSKNLRKQPSDGDVEVSAKIGISTHKSDVRESSSWGSGSVGLNQSPVQIDQFDSVNGGIGGGVDFFQTHKGLGDHGVGCSSIESEGLSSGSAVLGILIVGEGLEIGNKNRGRILIHRGFEESQSNDILLEGLIDVADSGGFIEDSFCDWKVDHFNIHTSVGKISVGNGDISSEAIISHNGHNKKSEDERTHT